MKQLIRYVCFGWLLTSVCLFAAILVSNEGSERATVGNGNKLVTYEGKTHVVWQDISREGYLNRVKTYDQMTGQWSEPFTLGTGIDNHARPIITVDYDGYLHVIQSGHNSPVSWRRSVRPNDSSAWQEPEQIGEGTYPVVLCDKNNTLYLTMRGNNHIGVDFYAKPEGKPWRYVTRIVKNAEEYREAYGAFHMNMAFGPDGTIHAVIDFYEGQDHVGRGLHQAVCYVKSPDGGNTWMKANSSVVKTPARPEAMDTLIRSTRTRVEHLPRPEHRNLGLAVDGKGTPFVFYYSHGEAPGQLYVATPNAAGEFRKRSLSYLLEEQWPGMCITDGKVTKQAGDRICLLATLSPLNDEWLEGRPTRAMNMKARNDQRLVLLSLQNGDHFEVQSVLEPGEAYNSPNLEKPAGANHLPASTIPKFMLFNGSSGYPGGGDYYQKPAIEYLKAGEFWTNDVFLYGMTE